MCLCVHMYMCVHEPAEARGSEISESGVIGDSELPDMGAWIWIQIFCRSSIQLKPWAISPAPVYFLISVVLTLLLLLFLLFNYLPSIILHIYVCAYIHIFIYCVKIMPRPHHGSTWQAGHPLQLVPHCPLLFRSASRLSTWTFMPPSIPFH